jgi:hypothetical protein
VNHGGHSSNWRVKSSQAAVILSVLYDPPRILSVGDPLLQKMDHFTRVLEKAAHSPQSILRELLPWMKYIPSSLGGWKGVGEENFRIFSKIFGDLYREVEERIVRIKLLYVCIILTSFIHYASHSMREMKVPVSSDLLFKSANATD